MRTDTGDQNAFTGQLTDPLILGGVAVDFSLRTYKLDFVDTGSLLVTAENHKSPSYIKNVNIFIISIFFSSTDSISNWSPSAEKYLST